VSPGTIISVPPDITLTISHSFPLSTSLMTQIRAYLSEIQELCQQNASFYQQAYQGGGNLTMFSSLPQQPTLPQHLVENPVSNYYYPKQ
jgi:hypothetical protein